MVHGLETFRTDFEDCTNQYVFIDGIAYDIFLEKAGIMNQEEEYH